MSVDSVLAQRYDGLMTPVVVDNKSTDKSRDILRRIESLTLVESEANDGFGRAANSVALRSQADFVAFLNPDASADPDWLAKVVPWMHQGELDFASSVVRAGRHNYFAGGRYLRRLGTTLLEREAGLETDWISGCALIVRTAAFKKLGGFDEKFFLYFEDVDLSLRARAMQMKLRVFPEALVDHPQHGMSTNRLGRRKAEIAYESRGRLIAKHVVSGWQPAALAFTTTLSPLRNGVELFQLSAVAKAVLRGYREASREIATSRSSVKRATVGVFANIFEGGAGILAGGHTHFIEVVKRWHDVDVVVFGPEMARSDLMKALPNAAFVALPSLNAFHAPKAVEFFYRSIAAVARVPILRRCDAFLSTSHLLPDVVPAILAGRPAAVVVHHLVTSRTQDQPRANAISVIAEHVSLFLIRIRARSLIAGSHLMLRQLRERKLNISAVVTTNGVDHLAFPTVSEDDPCRSGAVFVGRLHPSKNPADAIRAWKIVSQRFPAERLTIIGAREIPQYARELDALVADLGLEECVRFAGAVRDDEKLAALTTAKVFLFPSREEGWGIAVAEAMRAGLPCVTYDLPIFTEIFPQGRLSVAVGDHVGLAMHMINLFCNEALRVRYARQAMELAHTFTWQRASRIEADAMAPLLAR